MKKFIPLLTLLAIAVSACSNFTHTKIAGDIDEFLGIKGPEYQQPITANITANLELSVPFSLYLTNEGCSSCEVFSPIIDKYQKEVKLLTYKYDVNKDRNEFNELIEKHGDFLFGKNKSNVTTPTYLLVDKDKNIYNVNYNSYMKTEGAFYNFMNSKFSLSNVYFTTGDVMKKNFVNKEFIYIYLDFNNINLRSILDESVLPNAYKSTKTTIISDYYEDDFMHVKITGKDKNGQEYVRQDNQTIRHWSDIQINEIFY